jgi:hypothetical protein
MVTVCVSNAAGALSSANLTERPVEVDRALSLPGVSASSAHCARDPQGLWSSGSVSCAAEA